MERGWRRMLEGGGIISGLGDAEGGKLWHGTFAGGS